MAKRDRPARPSLRVVRSADDDGGSAEMFTIKDVADACGLPQPVIAQVVPRTWTDEGWMYTKAQMQASVGIAADLRREARRSGAGDAPGSSP